MFIFTANALYLLLIVLFSFDVMCINNEISTIISLISIYIVSIYVGALIETSVASTFAILSYTSLKSLIPYRSNGDPLRHYTCGNIAIDAQYSTSWF